MNKLSLFICALSALFAISASVDCSGSGLDFSNGVDGSSIKGSDYWDNLGAGVVGLDLNLDGIDDVVTTSTSQSLDPTYGLLVWGRKGTWPSPISAASSSVMKFTISSSSSYSDAFKNMIVVDMNNDGHKDLVISVAFSSTSIIYVLYARNDWLTNITSFDLDTQIKTTSIGFKILSSEMICGQAIAAIGKYNNDIYQDIMIGCPTAAVAGYSSGRIYVIYGRSSFPLNFTLKDLTPSEGFYFDGLQSYDYIGTYISSAGDFNNDGQDDFMFSRYDIDIGSYYSAGRVYVVYGGSGKYDLTVTLNGNNGFTIDGTTYSENMGSGVFSAGDISGDGISDIAFYGEKLYFVFGQQGFNKTTFDVKTLNNANGFASTTASSIAAIGDINNDNIDDFLYKSNDYWYGYAGIVYGHSGNWSSTLTTDFTFGFATVSTMALLGDVNNDGWLDFAAGTPTTSGGVMIAFGMPRIPNCGECHPSGCARCDYGFGYYNSSGTLNCTSCEAIGSDLWSHGDTACKSCRINNCIHCKVNYGYCTECEFGHYPSNSYSYEPPKCSNCTEGLQYNYPSGVICTNCNIKFNESNCLSCDMRHGYCNHCPSGYTPDGYGCKRCGTKQYSNGIDPCQNCEMTDGCLTCAQSKGHCTSCPTGTRVYGTGCIKEVCEACPTQEQVCN